MLFLYNILFPFAFIFFIPGMIIKLIRRSGEKSNYLERFSIFSKKKKQILKQLSNPIWIHSVSVGETVIAVSMIKKWKEKDSTQNFILSTTTTTGQALAKRKVPENVIVIFCPIDFLPFVKKSFTLIKPAMLIIFETEIWPNLISKAHSLGIKTALVNARISDKSVKGYKRFSAFFAPTLKKISLLCIQTELDGNRFKSIEKSLTPIVCGNMKFDQLIPESFPNVNIATYFGTGKQKIILAASTHPGEEKLFAEVFKKLKPKYSNLKMIIVPRHAERGIEISSMLSSMQIIHIRRSKCPNPSPDELSEKPDILLADTTGELLSFMKEADIVIMGKSFAGHTEGHNIIEPALLGKLVISGCTLRNFRYTLKAMQNDNAIVTVEDDKNLESTLEKYINNTNECLLYGERAANAVKKHTGATERTIELCRKLLK